MHFSDVQCGTNIEHQDYIVYQLTAWSLSSYKCIFQWRRFSICVCWKQRRLIWYASNSHQNHIRQRFTHDWVLFQRMFVLQTTFIYFFLVHLFIAWWIAKRFLRKSVLCSKAFCKILSHPLAIEVASLDSMTVWCILWKHIWNKIYREDPFMI